MSDVAKLKNVNLTKLFEKRQCGVCVYIQKWVPYAVAMGMFTAFFIFFAVLYSCRERERFRTYYGRIDAQSQKEEETRAVEHPVTDTDRPDEREAEKAAIEDELHGRNPNLIKVVTNPLTPSNASSKLRVLQVNHRRMSRTNPRSNVKTSSITAALSAGPSAVYAPRILFDNTTRGIEIMDLMGKNPLVAALKEVGPMLRETLVDVAKGQIDEIRDRKHVVFGLSEGGEPVVKGAEILGEMHTQKLVLSLVVDAIPMKILCFEAEMRDPEAAVDHPTTKKHSGSNPNSQGQRQSNLWPTNLDPHKKESGSKGGSWGIRPTQEDETAPRAGGAPGAKTPVGVPARSPAPSRKEGRTVKGPSGKDNKKKGTSKKESAVEGGVKTRQRTEREGVMTAVTPVQTTVSSVVKRKKESGSQPIQSSLKPLKIALTPTQTPLETTARDEDTFQSSR